MLSGRVTAISHDLVLPVRAVPPGAPLLYGDDLRVRRDAQGIPSSLLNYLHTQVQEGALSVTVAVAGATQLLATKLQR
jgi:hypothetical protein